MAELWWLIVLVAISLTFSASPEENLGDPSVFEGDIKLLPDQKFAIDNDLDLDSFGASTARRWTNGVFTYILESSLSKESRATTVINSAMKEWSDKTCIRFKRRSSETAYVEFFKGSGCWSYVGMTGRKQRISLAGGCWYHGIVVHEIGHALGFWHEQSRRDRDDYITIVWDNINESNKHNFKIHSSINSLNVPYDYGSIMHYGRRAFSKNGRDTILQKKPGPTIGQRRGLSQSDAKQMNLMYNCKKGTSRPPTPPKPETTRRPPTASSTPPKPETTRRPFTARPTASSGKIEIYIRSEGCEDRKLVNVHCGRAYIYVNRRDYARKGRGHNIVLVNYQTGRVEESFSFDTHGSYSRAQAMANYLADKVKRYPGRVVLIAIQDEGYTRLTSNARRALVRVGAKEPFTHGYRGSYALVGYTGPGKPSWIRQVQKARRRGPSIISMSIQKGRPPVTNRPPTTTRPTAVTGRPPVTPSSTSVPGSCGVPSISSRVIGGVNAVPGAWPWQIALLRNGRFTCGGSLIYKDWIVTAAHCISSLNGPSYTILLGAHNRNSPQSHEQRIRGKRVIKHPRYNTPVLNNDIALIQLERPAKLSSRVSTVCLPSRALPLKSTCYITGWGKIKHPGSSHHTLQQAKLPPVDQEKCKRKLAQSPGGSRLSITDQMLCAGTDDSRLSGCHGDSGGPYVCEDSSKRFVLHGVVSWGSPRCASSERYTVFARVAKLRSWIDQEIRRARG